MVRYFSPAEVALELKVKRPTVYEWLRTGKLHGDVAEGFWRVSEDALNAFRVEHGYPPPTVVER